MMDELALQDEDRQIDPDPFDHYEAYSEWLLTKSGYLICNGDDLVRYLEAGSGFDEFLQSLPENV